MLGSAVSFGDTTSVCAFALVYALTGRQVSLAYDVDVTDAGLLGAGAYGTVLAAVHRSTGRQVRTSHEDYSYYI